MHFRFSKVFLEERILTFLIFRLKFIFLSSRNFFIPHDTGKQTKKQPFSVSKTNDTFLHFTNDTNPNEISIGPHRGRYQLGINASGKLKRADLRSEKIRTFLLYLFNNQIRN